MALHVLRGCIIISLSYGMWIWRTWALWDVYYVMGPRRWIRSDWLIVERNAHIIKWIMLVHSNSERRVWFDYEDKLNQRVDANNCSKMQHLSHKSIIHSALFISSSGFQLNTYFSYTMLDALHVGIDVNEISPRSDQSIWRLRSIARAHCSVMYFLHKCLHANTHA